MVCSTPDVISLNAVTPDILSPHAVSTDGLSVNVLYSKKIYSKSGLLYE